MAKEYDMRRKSVVFNLDDPDQFAMFQHAGKRTNFSDYVKRLILRDMAIGEISNTSTERPYERPKELEVQTDKAAPNKPSAGGFAGMLG